MIHALIKLHVGNPERYGLPAPDHKFGEAHPTVSGRILDRIAHGTIAPKPNIRRFDGDEVEFDDGSRAHADVVVYCTGYKISFPFFDADLISAPENHIELFRRVFHPEFDDVFFVALLQPLGATMPLAEAQGQWIADYLKGEYALPPRPALLQDIEDETAAMRKRYVASKRHTIQVDFDDYLHALGKERRAGAERARRQGFRLPVAPGAARAQVAGMSAAAGLGKRERTKAANREAILVAARRVFSDIGYGAASVRDVVRETDLATGTFYNYFPDKESVLRALVDEITVEARARVHTARMAATTLEGFVSGGFRAYFEFLAEDPDTVALMRRNSGTIRAMFDEPALGAGIDELRADLETAVTQGRIPPHDADLMAVAMVGAGVEIGLHMVERDPPDVERAVGFVTDVFLGAFERIG